MADGAGGDVQLFGRAAEAAEASRRLESAAGIKRRQTADHG